MIAELASMLVLKPVWECEQTIRLMYCPMKGMMSLTTVSGPVIKDSAAIRISVLSFRVTLKQWIWNINCQTLPTYQKFGIRNSDSGPQDTCHMNHMQK
jgi:hypothetical protein